MQYQGFWGRGPGGRRGAVSRGSAPCEGAIGASLVSGGGGRAAAGAGETHYRWGLSPRVLASDSAKVRGQKNNVPDQAHKNTASIGRKNRNDPQLPCAYNANPVEGHSSKSLLSNIHGYLAFVRFLIHLPLRCPKRMSAIIFCPGLCRRPLYIGWWDRLPSFGGSSVSYANGLVHWTHPF